MTILSSHPRNCTAYVQVNDPHRIAPHTTYIVRPIRRIAGLTLRGCAIDILRNNLNVVRADWDAHVTIFGIFTVAIVRTA